MLELSAFAIDVPPRKLSGGPLAWPAGTIVELFGLSDSAVGDYCLLLAGLIDKIERTVPAEKGRVRRKTVEFSPKDLCFLSLNKQPVYDFDNEIRAKMIGVVFGRPDMYVLGDNVLEEFQYSFAAAGVSRPDMHSLERYGLYTKTHLRTEKLSGGEQLRLNWACILELRPLVIVADMSQSNLDEKFVIELLEWLVKDRQERVTVVYGLHPGAFGELPTQRWVVNDGTISPGDPNPHDFPTLRDEGRQLEQAFEARNVSQDQLLEVRDLHHVGLTKGVSFGIRRGEMLQIRGPNGVGKTTLGKILCRRIEGEQVGGSCRPLLSEFAPIMSIQYPERFFLQERIHSAVRGDGDLLELCDIAIDRHGNPSNPLSSSKQKLLSTAIALKLSRGFAVLDEPTAGMDFADKLRFIKLLNKYKELAVVVFSHDPSLLKIGTLRVWEEIVA